ncbi:TRAP transporter small permease subunit [Desulfitibacter alkalitolerans]|uniref:TRAP transporter small permease subunit n=1 Tax=Desulfitibacter alkalitolerans TaxID=264641 RepID=UPI000488D313|nr:TRAP transporter small permease subunit [Desulfitibacter alkalitolerans]
MKVWSKVEQTIDFISEVLGKFSWLLILYCMIFGLTDVILRYAFNQPSLWISVTVQYAMVLLACSAGAYALNNDAFVKLDLFYARFSPKTKAICDIITFFIAFLYLYVLVTKGIQAAKISFFLKQVTPTAIPIPLYHLKAFIPVGAFCVLLVAIKKLVIDIQTVIGYDRSEQEQRTV